MTPEDVRDLVSKISAAVQMPIAPPRGRTVSELQTYFEAYDAEQVAVFIERLSTSRHVKSPVFTLKRIITENIAGTLLAGGIREKQSLDKYYSPQVLSLRRKPQAFGPAPALTADYCPQCHNILYRYTIILDNKLAHQTLCQKCHHANIVNLEQNVEAGIKTLLGGIGIPSRYFGATCQVNGMDTAVRTALAGFSRGLLLFGASGAGKTYQLIGWLKYALFKGKTVHYVDWSDFQCELRANLGNYNKLVASVMGAEIVFIDDFKVGNAYLEDFAYNFLKRLYREKITVFMTAPDLPYQEQFATRISEMMFQYELKTI